MCFTIFNALDVDKFQVNGKNLLIIQIR
jgi:hypothetical protein